MQIAVNCHHMLTITIAIMINSYYIYWLMVVSYPWPKKQWDKTFESFWRGKVDIQNKYYN